MEYYKLTIKEISGLLQKKEVTSLELTRFFLDRIEKIDNRLQACISVFREEAEKRAIKADERIAKGEKGFLLGIPYLCKDNILTKNLKTTAASKMLENYIAPYNATVIEKLNEAGAVLLGKTNLDEFAHGASTENSAFFVSKNPWDQNRVPGGSSGGSAAAVSAGLCVFALGSDTGGSIRQPSSFCGVSGLKPSYSRVSRYGLMSMTSSTDVIGPITKSAEDAALVMNIIVGFDKNDLTSCPLEVEDYTLELSRKIRGKKMGVVWEYIDSLDKVIADKTREAIDVFKSLGVEIVSISLPYDKYAVPVYYIITPSEISSNLARLDGIRYGFSCDLKAKGGSSENLNDIYLKNRGQSFGQEVKRRIVLGTYALSSGYFDAYYKKAIAVREKIKQDFKNIFKKVDFILTPTSPHVAFKIGEKVNDPLKMYLEDIFVTGPSLAGLPAISIPAGFVEKMPIGIQLFANKFEESLILNLASEFQSETKYHQEFPVLD